MEQPDHWYSDAAATFGDRLAAARDQAGLSQKAVAQRLGVKPSLIAAWEEDRKEPRANRLAMLSGMLGISLSWLMTGQGDGPDGPPSENIPLDADVSETLAEMRALQAQIVQSTQRLSQLEKQLRAHLGQVG